MPAASTSLRPLRLKLTIWYLATLCVILMVLGGGLFLAIERRFSRELGQSLRDATAQLERAAETRELESTARGRVVDAVEELHVTDRSLFLLDSAGAPITPLTVPRWVTEAAGQTPPAGGVDLEHREGRGPALQLHAERFQLTNGRPMIAVAVADKIELEDRYSQLITSFGAAAAIALVLVAIGGWLLVRQSTAPIERSIEQMRRFMADAAHELRTPITVLRTQAEVALQREREREGYVTALRSIEGESRRLGRIVDDLLTLARADSGDSPVSFARVFLDDVVMDAVGAAGALASARGVELVLGECEEAPVRGDAELLRQLVMIVLDNAIKYTPAGGRVDVAVGQHGGEAVLTVSDNGPGIAPEHLPHVFERFYRGDPARGRENDARIAAGGAGLGLSIARWIAETHGAHLSVASTVDAGTVVAVQLPVVSSS